MTRIFLVGFMACGKTTLGKNLAKSLGLSFVDLDMYIEGRYYKSVSDIFSELGEEKFREIERRILHEVSEFEDVVISTGGGTPCFFDNMEYMNTMGETIYLNTNTERIAERIKAAGDKRPLVRGKKDDELKIYIEEMKKKRESFYKKAKHTLDSTFLEDYSQIRETVSKAIEILSL